jgi:aldose 1-epimerase
MTRFAAEATTRDDEPVVALRDTASGAAAQVWPGCGDNCFSLALAGPGGRVGTVIAPPPTLAEIRRRPSWWGIPLLFPFPGVIPRGEYTFRGRRLRLGRPDQPIVSEGKEFPGARRDYHGFVMDLPWRVAAAEGGDAAATVRSTLDSVDHPDAHEGFPFPYRVEATYRLDGTGLRLHFRATNTGDGPLPFGFGAHPFFKIPLGGRGAAEDCLLHIPAARRWNPQRLRDLPAGAPVSAEDVLVPVPSEIDLRAPKPFAPRAYNGLFAGLAHRDGMIECFARDPASNLETVMRASPHFRYVVFWSPPDPQRSEVCFEPWTCPGNVFNLAALGIPGHGLIVLDSGASWDAEMHISLRAAVADRP